MARVYVERRELPAELFRLLEAHPAGAECTPLLDIIETGAGIEAILDLPGVPRASIEILFSAAPGRAPRRRHPHSDHALAVRLR